MISLNWVDFKSFLDVGTIQFKYLDHLDKYEIFGFDGNFQIRIILMKGGLEATEFETNYKDKGNKSIQTKIQEEDIPTGGHYQSQSFELAVAAADTTKVLDISFPMPISVLSGEVTGNSIYTGDDLIVEVAPDTITGTLTVDAAIGATTLDVSQTVIDNADVGYYYKIYDGTNQDDLGRCLSIDKVNNQMTFETATVNAFAAATPSYIQQTVKYVPHLRLPENSRIVIGESKIGGSYMPANTVMRVTYVNNSLTAKTFSFIMEYLY